jgi:protein-S-isoprenylcysteine O-methyltransferase Ste14
MNRRLGQSLGLVLRNVVFTVVVPGLGGAWLPWWLLTHGTRGTTSTPAPAAWAALPVIAAGAALYFWCAWNFAAVGGGTPGPWDAPRRVVARGPYRWVRNPIYLAALLVVLGEAWLFASPRLLAYAAVMAACFHLFVTGYEERTLARRFGPAYLEYRRAVPRWIPRKPAYPAGGATTGAGKSRV